MALHSTLLYLIAVGTGGQGGGQGPPQYFTLETSLIFIHAAQIAMSQCILHLASQKWKCFLRLCISTYAVPSHSACFYLTLPCSTWFQLPSTMVLPWLYLILPCLSYEIHFNNCLHSPSASSSSPPQTAPLQSASSSVFSLLPPARPQSST